jgi:hypothetical protein
MRVSDSGAGFDAQTQASIAASPESESGRGLEILQLYATSVSFNTRGNQVELLRVFNDHLSALRSHGCGQGEVVVEGEVDLESECLERSS